jgi:SAM-dependent methyltransferase
MINAKKMAEWWRTELGQYVFSEEKAVIESFSEQINGYFQTQVFGVDSLLPAPKIPCCQFLIGEHADIRSMAEFLPLKRNSLDVMILPHVLEFSADPHQVLREAERVLADGGTLVLCTFKPFSLFGLRHLFSIKRQMPWQGRYFSHSRIKDWLALLNFEIIKTNNVVYVPPFSSANNLTRWAFMNKWGKRFWPRFSSVSIIVAKKRVLPLTPASSVWLRNKIFPNPGLIKPVTGYNSQSLDREQH